MNKSRGITMISLVVMITSIILLSTLSIGFGYRYIKETKDADKEYFKEVLSNAVTKRESKYSLNSLEYPRIGYSINTKEALDKVLNDYIKTQELVSNSDFLFDRGKWYIVDTGGASKLGVKESKNYLDVFDKNSDKKMKLALVDYLSGTVILFDINKAQIAEINGSLSGDSLRPNENHEHDFNVASATCTEDKKCLICGFVEEVALGHKYEGGVGTEYIDDEFHYIRTCSLCGAMGGYERHKEGYAFYPSGDEWYHYKGCSICGWTEDIKEYEKCTIRINSRSDEYHAKECIVCEHKEISNHDLKYAKIDNNYHEYACVTNGCSYVRVPLQERHEDIDNDNLCDKCFCEIIDNPQPVLTEVSINNKEYVDSKYVTKGETIQLSFTSDKRLKQANVKICEYDGDYITYTHSTDKKTWVAELYVDSSITIPKNVEVTFEINCVAEANNEEMLVPITNTTDGSYLIYDDVPPEIEYIFKAES